VHCHLASWLSGQLCARRWPFVPARNPHRSLPEKLFCNSHEPRNSCGLKTCPRLLASRLRFIRLAFDIETSPLTFTTTTTFVLDCLRRRCSMIRINPSIPPPKNGLSHTWYTLPHENETPRCRTTNNSYCSIWPMGTPLPRPGESCAGDGLPFFRNTWWCGIVWVFLKEKGTEPKPLASSIRGTCISWVAFENDSSAWGGTGYPTYQKPFHSKRGAGGGDLFGAPSMCFGGVTRSLFWGVTPPSLPIPDPSWCGNASHAGLR
jgi:hypothetical protein